MSIISRYILMQTAAPLLATIAIALLVLLTERMLRLLDLVLGSSGGLAVLVEMLAYLVPHYMALALPVALFLGVLLAFSRLHHEHELDALASAGIGLSRLMRPVLLLALCLALLSALNFSIGQPYARYIYRALVHSVGEESVNVYLRARTFMEVDGVTFMAERIGSDRRTFGNVFIYDESDADRSLAMTARSGRLSTAADGDLKAVILQDGVAIEFDRSPETADADVRPDFGVVHYSRVAKPIDLDDPTEFRPRGEDERELTLLELWSTRANPPPDVTTDQMLAEFHDRIVRTLSVLLLPLLAVSFAFGRRRSDRVFGIAVGLLILITYNQALTIGKSLVSIGDISIFVGHWLPFVALTIASSVLFYRTARMPGDGFAIAWPSIGAGAFAWRPGAKRSSESGPVSE
jgi:lipopolysaccharide export system permease protein